MYQFSCFRRLHGTSISVALNKSPEAASGVTEPEANFLAASGGRKRIHPYLESALDVRGPVLILKIG
jgi:hypothetical protein